MTRYEHVLELLDAAVGGKAIGAHGRFWHGLTRDAFVAKRVYGEQLVIVGNGAGSNLVRALRGQAPFGSDIGTTDATYPRMPARLPPLSVEDIAFIETWINDGCLEDPLPGRKEPV